MPRLEDKENADMHRLEDKNDTDMHHLEDKEGADIVHLEDKEDADMHWLEDKEDSDMHHLTRRMQTCRIWQTVRRYLVHQLRCGGDGKQWALQSHLSQHASQGPHIYPCPTCTASQCLYMSH